MAEKRWLKGDTHFHSANSDGIYPFGKLLDECKKRKLDWMIITDHNKYTIDKAFYHKDMLVIPGEEYTGNNGHLNIWGSGLPALPEGRPESYGQYTEVSSDARKAGGVISVNHPFCKKCGWHMELEGFGMDCVEVWNAPMHIDNMTNLQWWHSQLLKGRRLAAVGGSDFHRDYYVTKLIGCPTTYVYVEENTEQAVLSALKSGHSFVTNSPKATQLYLSCGGAVVGDEVEWNADLTASVRAVGLKRKHILRVWNNDKLIFEHRAGRTGDYSVSVPVVERGFMRAEVFYSYGKAAKAVYGKITAKMMPLDAGIDIPDFAYCFTNPIYFI